MAGTIKEYFDYCIDRLDVGEHFCVTFFDDKKNGSEFSKEVYVTSYDNLKIGDLIKEFNEDQAYGCHFALNSLTKAKRCNDNVCRILNIGIDIDGGVGIEDYNKVKSDVYISGIKSSVESESKNGYHIIIPVDLKVSEHQVVIKYLKYLKDKVCSNVDLDLKKLSGMLRAPGTTHHKGDPFKLKIISFDPLSNADVIKNTDIIKKIVASLPEDEKPMVGSTRSAQKPSRNLGNEVFFSSILNDKKLHDYLSGTSNINKSSIFFKNLGIYCKLANSPEMTEKAKELIKQCGHKAAQLNSWINNSMNEVNYLEIAKWVNQHKLKPLLPLIDDQLDGENFFMMQYSFYYFDGEKGKSRFFLCSGDSNIGNLHDKIQLVETLDIEAVEQGLDMFDIFDVPNSSTTTDRNGGSSEKDLTYTAMMQILTTNVHKYLKKYNLLKKVQCLGYKPTNEREFIFQKRKYLNIYNPSKFSMMPITKPPHEFPCIEKHLRHLCVNDENYDYFNKWLAHILQYPSKKLPTAIVFMGAHGTGKGKFVEWVIRPLFGDTNIKLINQDLIKSGFADYVEGSQLIVADEITLNQERYREVCHKVKSYVSEEQADIGLKHKDAKPIRNYSHWIFTSNHEFPLFIEEGDRRYTVIEQTHPIPKKIINASAPDANNERYKTELYHYYCYLKSLKVGFTDVGVPLETESKQAIINESIANSYKFIEDIRSHETFKNFCTENIDFSIEEDGTVSVERLYQLFTLWCKNNGYKASGKRKFTGDLKRKYNLVSEQRKIDNENRKRYDVNEIMKKGIKEFV